MTKIKRFFIVLTACFLLMPMIVLVVRADVIVEPQNNFFFAHRNDCTYISRSFYANGPDGFVSLKKEPGSKEEVTARENNEVLYISHTYDYNGEIWGVAEINDEVRRWVYGWVPMEQLLLIYDYISFAEDHKDELYPYEGNYEELEAVEKIVYWKYPGSGIVAGVLNENVAERVESFKNFEYQKYIEYIYTDEQGREWGFTAWGWGGKNLWICLSDPENTDIPVNSENPTATVWQPDANNYTDNADNPDTGFSETSVVIILLIILITATGVLIRIFWKPNRQNNNS